MAESNTIKFVQEGRVGKIILNRPEKRNSLTLEMVEELHTILQDCNENDDIKVVVITGEGDAFCAGGDLKAMKDSGDVSYYMDKVSKKFLQVLFRIRNIRKLVIAAVNGFATGAGFGLLLACDLRIAVESAELTTGFMKVGGSPSAGTTYFLPRITGWTKANELIFLADTITAEKALEFGILNKVVAGNEDLKLETDELAKKLSYGPTAALAKAKMLLNQSCENSLVPQLEAEAMNLVLSGKTADFQEGLDAFIEKRKPVFKGK